MSLHGTFEVSIDGRSYRVVQEQYSRRFLDVVRQQADTSGEPSEASLNPNDLWRRSQDDWVLGDGQKVLDDSESSRKRYFYSYGLDFSEKGVIRPHRRLVPNANFSGVAKKAIRVAGAVMIAKQASIFHFHMIDSSWTEVATLGGDISDITTDGTLTYQARTGGVHALQADHATNTKINDLVATKIAYVNGRLVAANGINLYEITDPNSLVAPAAFYSGGVARDFVWDCFTGSPDAIYAGGHSGTLGYLYRISARESDGALTAPVVVAQLPIGEYATSLVSYLGFLLIGTNKGFRCGRIQGDGVVYGPLRATSVPVVAIEVTSKNVYFGDAGVVWQVDLSRFVPQFDLLPSAARALNCKRLNTTVTPAVVENTEAQVVGVMPNDAGRRFVVTTDSFMEEDTTNYDNSFMMFMSGRVSYGLPDSKQAMFLDVDANVPNDQQIDVYWLTDDAIDTYEATVTARGVYLQSQLPAANKIGSLRNVNGKTSFPISGVFAKGLVVFAWVFDGTWDTPPTVVGTVERYTIRALPVPSRTEQIQAMLDLRDSVVGLNGAVAYYDVVKEFLHLQSLVRSGAPVVYEEFGRASTASLENVQLGPELQADVGGSNFEGVCMVTLKVYA